MGRTFKVIVALLGAIGAVFATLCLSKFKFESQHDYWQWGSDHYISALSVSLLALIILWMIIRELRNR